MQPNSDSQAQTPPLHIPADLAQCAFVEAISADPRPTYVLDLHDDGRSNIPVFWNSALENLPLLFNSVKAGIADSTQWVSFVLKARWKVVSADSVLADTANKGSATHDVGSSEMLAAACAPNFTSAPQSAHHQAKASKRTVPFDDAPMPSTTTDTYLNSRKRSSAVLSTSRIRGDSSFAKFFCEFDWSSTELGDIESWPQQLIELCNLMLASPDPKGIYWGPEAILLYNEPVTLNIANRHPRALGQRLINIFPEIWHGQFDSYVENIISRRQPYVRYTDRRVSYKSRGLEEVFWEVTLIPIFGDGDIVTGTWATLYDATTQHFWQRRIATLLRFTASMNSSESGGAMWNAFIEGFEGDNRDVPHLIVYRASEYSTTTFGALPSNTYILETSVGYDVAKAPYKEVDISLESDGLAQLFRQTQIEDAPICFKRTETSLSAQFWDAMIPINAHDVCKEIAIVPIRPSQAKHALAYLVIGLNPVVRYDQDYREFLDLARRQISSTMASIILREEDLRRERLVAEEASHQLGLWKAEAELHEVRFRRLAETAPIGICTYGPDASLTYANDVYRVIFNMTDGDDVSSPDWWARLVHADDLEMAKAMFGRLLMQREDVTFEIRVKWNPKYKATASPEGYIWVLVTAYADPTRSGPQTVIACFTDINERKRAEDHQERRLQDLIQAKRQQEAFIDMTSHEIRNPLSVVLQCSEELISACTSLRSELQEGKVTLPAQDLENILDAAETIEFCTLHQKRIVDDILTLSKLESDLLPVTPDSVRPLALIDGIMKLFEREIRKSEMKMEVSVHPTFKELDLGQVLLDPSRISQIVINLISNAIKFTKTQPQSNRRISILVGGSVANDPPSKNWPVSYMDRQQPLRQGLFSEHWNESSSAHIHFAVQDTGAGMTFEEQQRIFARFTQASTRTHVKYGGSGLGLYICRALSETHGGQIGCRSTLGQGSTFGFQVEVGRLSPQMRQSNAIPTARSKPLSGINGLSDVNTMLVKPRDVGPMSPKAAATTLQKEPSPNPMFRVLVVEDNVLNQKVLRRQLEKAGHTVVVAHHGQDALDFLQRTRSWADSDKKEPAFDFILMDVEMPIMNGLVCTQRIRAYEKEGLMLGHIPIIATTGNARDEHTQMAKSAGMDQVVLKPYSLSVLLPIAQKLMAQHG